MHDSNKQQCKPNINWTSTPLNDKYLFNYKLKIFRSLFDYLFLSYPANHTWIQLSETAYDMSNMTKFIINLCKKYSIPHILQP